LRIGLHTSHGGSLEKAAQRAIAVGANTFQIFSSSPRMWRQSTRDPVDVRCMQRLQEKHDLYPLIVHDSYLINLGTTHPAIRPQSIAAFRGELERAMLIGADYLVMHPGNYKGQSIEEGLMAVIEGISEAARGLQSDRLMILLENTVGAGAQLGSRFEELRVLCELTQQRIDFGMGYCLDTCHCFASGRYDVSTEAGLRETMKMAESILGIGNVKVIHCNDSKGIRGSHVDRHQHIGQGYIGMDGFRRILNHSKLRNKAFILETPVDEPGDDRRNLETLKSLCRRSSTTIKRSS
jgi:deoxyribonuclease-4